MSYEWSLRKYWWGWFKRDIARWIYSKIYKFDMSSYNGTLLPSTGKGKYVSVYVKKEITQMINEETGEEIRLIPVEYNHGVMVEYWKNGKMHGRSHMDINMFKRAHLGNEEIDDIRKIK